MAKKGIPLSKLHKRHIGDARRKEWSSGIRVGGWKLSDKNKKNIGNAKIGDKNPSKQIWVRKKISNTLTGRKLSEEHRKKVVAILRKRCSSPEWKKMMSKKLSGENHYNWQGGKSFEIYSVDWTKSLRISIRERDKYICRICGEKQGDKAFDVHHIDYDKQNCSPNNLITLCRKCHSKTYFNRSYWTDYFQNY